MLKYKWDDYHFDLLTSICGEEDYLNALLTPIHGIQCIHVAAAVGNISFIEKYIDFVSTLKDEQGNTCAHYACAFEQEETFTFILEKYPESMMWRNNVGQIPIHFAFAKGCMEILITYQDEIIQEKLLDVKDNNGNNGILLSASSNTAALYANFRDKSKEQTNNNGETILHRVVKLPDSILMCSSIINENPKLINIPDKNGIIPLFLIASTQTSEKYLDLFLYHHVNLNHQDNQGNSILHYCVYYKNYLYFKKLWNFDFKEINHTIFNAKGRSVLDTAAFVDNRKAIKKILNTKSNDFKYFIDHSGRTPMHAAALRGNIACVELLNPYFDINRKDNNGITPLKIILKHKNAELITNMFHLGAQPDHYDEYILLKKKWPFSDEDSKRITETRHTLIRERLAKEEERLALEAEEKRLEEERLAAEEAARLAKEEVERLAREAEEKRLEEERLAAEEAARLAKEEEERKAKEEKERIAREADEKRVEIIKKLQSKIENTKLTLKQNNNFMIKQEFPQNSFESWKEVENFVNNTFEKVNSKLKIEENNTIQVQKQVSSLENELNDLNSKIKYLQEKKREIENNLLPDAKKSQVILEKQFLTTKNYHEMIEQMKTDISIFCANETEMNEELVKLYSKKKFEEFDCSDISKLLWKMDLTKYQSVFEKSNINGEFIALTIDEPFVWNQLDIEKRDYCFMMFHFEMMKTPGYVKTFSPDYEPDCCVCSHASPEKTIHLLQEYEIPFDPDLILNNNFCIPILTFSSFKDILVRDAFSLNGRKMMKKIAKWKTVHKLHLRTLQNQGNKKKLE